MNNLANKEKNLNSLIEKLGKLSKSYAHDSISSEKLKIEKNKFLNEFFWLKVKFTEKRNGCEKYIYVIKLTKIISLMIFVIIYSCNITYL